MLATSQMEAIALAISAAFGGSGGSKETYVNKEAPTSAAALQAGLSALMSGR